MLTAYTRSTLKVLLSRAFSDDSRLPDIEGMCVYDPSQAQMNKDEFIKAADRALYNAKSSGENRIAAPHDNSNTMKKEDS